jgi:DNA-directed RNA polymerase specialized sigma24 family protein
MFDAGANTGLTDGQLLERFATTKGEAAELAFGSILERHGPMVFRVCRGILRDEHAAMDAFQATFLILVRRGETLWVRDSLGPWLHRVASRTAWRARADESRRRCV